MSAAAAAGAVVHLSTQPLASEQNENTAASTRPALAVAAESNHQVPESPANLNKNPLPAAALSDLVQRGLDSFNSSKRVTDFLTECTKSYRALREAQHKSQASLDNFKKACIHQTASDGTATVQLPRGLRIDLVKDVKFPTVEGEPNFHTDSTKQLQAVQQQASINIHRILLSSKQTLLKFLTAKCEIGLFCASKVDSFTTNIIDAYADTFDKDPAASAGQKFPRQAAADHFGQVLNTAITQIVFQGIDTQLDLDKEKEASKMAESAAQESVVAGLHTGSTMRLIAQQEALKILKRPNQSSRDGSASDAHSSPSATTATSPSATGQTTSPLDYTAGSRSSRGGASARNGRGRGGKRAMSPLHEGHRSPRSPPRQPSRREYAGHSANSRRDYHDRRQEEPPTVAATSLSSAPQRDKFFPKGVHFAADSPRSDYNGSASKNGQGGDKHQLSSHQQTSGSRSSRQHSPPRDRYQSNNARSEGGRSERYPAQSSTRRH